MPGKHSSHVVTLGLKGLLSCMTTVSRSLNTGSERDTERGGSKAIPFRYMPTTFSRHTYKLQLSGFMFNTGSTPITLFAFYGVQRFGRGQHKDGFNCRADLHLLYCKFPGLCRGRSAGLGRQTLRFLECRQPYRRQLPIGPASNRYSEEFKAPGEPKPYSKFMPAHKLCHQSGKHLK